MQRKYTLDALFDTQNANLVSKISQESCIDNLLDGPSAVDTRRNQLVLGLEALRTHCIEKALDFPLVCYRPVTLSTSEPRACWRCYHLTHLVPATVAEIEIGFISSLETKKSVAEDLLTLLYNVQTPVACIVEGNALKVWVSTSSVQGSPADLKPTKEPVDINKRANVGHHIQNLRGVHQRRRLRL